MPRFRTALLAAAAIAAGLPMLAAAQPPGGDERGDRHGGGRPEGGRPEGGRPDGGRADRGAAAAAPAAAAPAQAPQPAPRAPQDGGRNAAGDRGQRGGNPGDGRGFGRPGAPGGGGNFQRPDGRPPEQGFGRPGGDAAQRAADGDRRGYGGDPGRRGFAGGPGFDPNRNGYGGDRRGPGVDGGPGYRDGGPGYRDGGQRFAGGGRPGGPGGAANSNWRQDRRYDWRGWRDQHRDAFHAGRYVAPRGWGYGYRRFEIGFRLQPFFYASNYWIDDPYDYRLPPVWGSYRWVRYYNDVLLVDLATGEVVDAINDFFW